MRTPGAGSLETRTGSALEPRCEVEGTGSKGQRMLINETITISRKINILVIRFNYCSDYLALNYLGLKNIWKCYILKPEANIMKTGEPVYLNQIFGMLQYEEISECPMIYYT